MASRTISLEQHAYDLLKEAKQPGESFSMVVQRLLAPRRDPWRALVGLIPPEKADALREFLDHQREMDRQHTAERYKRLGLL